MSEAMQIGTRGGTFTIPANSNAGELVAGAAPDSHLKLRVPIAYGQKTK